MPAWKCDKCGNTVDSQSPPETCPACKEKCEFVDVSCYIPDCGGAGSPNVNPELYKKK